MTIQHDERSQSISLPSSEAKTQVSKAELREMDVRLRNLEKLYDVVKHVSDSAVESFNEYLEQKTESEMRASQLEDKQHRRASVILGYTITAVFALCIVAVLKEQFELVKLVLTSSFAVAAGAGLSTVIRNSKGRQK